MPAPRVRLSVLCMALAGLLVLGGCTTASFDRKAEREANLGKDLQALDKTTGEALPDRPLAFQEVLEIALRNNLELKVAQYELEIASRERVAARLDMLPRLDAEAASTRRSEPEVKAVLGPDGQPSGSSSVVSSTFTTYGTTVGAVMPGSSVIVLVR